MNLDPKLFEAPISEARQDSKLDSAITNTPPVGSLFPSDSQESVYKKSPRTIAFEDQSCISRKYYYSKIIALANRSITLEMLLDREASIFQTLVMEGVMVDHIKNPDIGKYVRITISERPGRRVYEIDLLKDALIPREIELCFSNADLHDGLLGYENIPIY